MGSRSGKNNLPRQFSAFKRPAFAFFVLMMASLSCVLDDIRPTPQPPTLTPAPQTGTDYLSYNVPSYAITLLPGQFVPGTGVRYESRSANQYNLYIDNKPLFTGGNIPVIWSGIMIPSVFGRYNLQFLPVVNSDNLNANGNVSLVIVKPNPSELAGLPAQTSGAIVFQNILIDETASVGQRIAGTSLVYDGERNGAAAFLGTNQFNLRSINSDVIWYGQLVNNVYTYHNLNVTSISAESVRLQGAANIYVIPR